MAARSVAGATPAAESAWLTLGQASRRLGVTASTIRKWSDQGQLPVFYTPGGHRRFRERDVEAFINRSSLATAREARPLLLLIAVDPALREDLGPHLELLGYEVRSSETGDDAAAELIEPSPDLVVLDLGSPPGGECRLLTRLQERHGPVAVVVFDSSPAPGQTFDPGRLIAKVATLV